ncbi:hypothetical protein LJC42_05770 [Eubacteriales bacterium OttesenSCG-928-K08]|nr:hypothetical protein [Eubacteriales bacterium OttesenSCG-928-K08]
MFQGRYGNDQLNRGLLFAGLGFTLLSWILPRNSVIRSLFYLMSLVLYGLAIFRMFSRSFGKRSAENAKFMAVWSRARAKWQSWRSHGPRAKTARKTPTFEERRKYKYFICTQCAQRLRVPRGKGKIMITCTRCGNKFQMKS